MVMQGAIGGVANESGSNHRSVGAALIAAYGLNGKGVSWLGGDAWPARIGLETDHAVDDIEVILSDKRSVHIQAKSSCGLGPSFRKSAAQWAAAAKTGEATSVSRFILLVSKPTGSLEVLRNALDHWRAGSTLPKGEEDSLNGVLKLMTTKHKLSSEDAEYVLKKVFVAILDTDPSGQASELGAALLDTSVVAAGAGTAALAILTNFFHDNSRQRKQTDLNDWRSALRAAQLPVHSDPNGVLAAQLQAEDEEIASYRGSLAKTKDEVNFFSLDLEVQKFVRPKCSEALRVRALGTPKSERQGKSDVVPLLNLTRRQGRFVLVGGPGVGKSFSLGQIAASLADQPNAPLPLLLRLRDVSNSLSALPMSSSWGFKEIAHHLAVNNVVLERALLARMQQGDVIYLFDGLDEVASDRSKIVGWLRDFLDNIDAHTDLVISSRYAAAGRADLVLPQFELLPPDDLTALTDDVLVKFSEGLAVEGDERTVWLQSRRAFVKLAQSQDRDLWRVPLLALLMIATLVDKGPESIPKSRSGLLRTAIESSVRRWEMRRLNGIEAGLPLDYQPQIVFDTFADIAGVVAGGGRRGDAIQAVVNRLPHWGIPAPAARSWAEAIVQFWDETAAVFVTSAEEGKLTARSRLFTELGVAMLLNRDTAAMKEWVLSNKEDADSYEAMCLLAGLDSSALDWIAEIALQEASELLDLVLRAVDEGATMDPSLFNQVLDRQLARLPDLPRDRMASTKPIEDRTVKARIKEFKTGPVDEAYRLAVRLAQHSLSGPQDAVLKDFADSSLNAVQRSIVLAIREISSPGHTVDSDEHWQVIADALPPRPDRSRKEGYVTPWRGIDTWGLHTITRFAAEKLTTERGNLALRVLAAAHMGPVFDVDDVHSLLVEKGLGDDLEILDFHIGVDTFGSLPESFMTTDQPISLLLECLGEPGESQRASLWHLTDAAAAYLLLRVNDVPFGELYWAIEKYPKLSAAVLRKMIDDSSLETSEVASQLRVASMLGRQGSVLLSIPSYRTSDPALSPTEGWEDLALAAWKSGNVWLGLQAQSMSLAADGLTEGFRSELEGALSELSPTSRRQVGVVVEYHHPGEAWLLSDHRARAGARRVQAVRAWEDKDYGSLIDYLQDLDLAVRNEAVPDEQLPDELVKLLPLPLCHPEFWSCEACGTFVGIDSDTCTCGAHSPDDEFDKLLTGRLGT